MLFGELKDKRGVLSINSVKKLRSSVVNPSTLNLLTAGRWFNVVNTKINRAFDSYANGSVLSCL